MVHCLILFGDVGLYPLFWHLLVKKGPLPSFVLYQLIQKGVEIYLIRNGLPSYFMLF